MKILACHPGASYSTADVYIGITGALRAAGHEVIDYRLDGRISATGAWLRYQVNRAKRMGGTPATYTAADVIYGASVWLIERALRLQPDWVFVVSAMYLHPDILIMMRRAGLRVAVLLTESPYDEEHEARILPFVDIAWTNERTSVPRLRAASGNANVYYLPHAYDPAKHRPMVCATDEGVPAHDVVFVGTYFQERIDLLSAVDWTGIDLGLYGETSPIPSRSRLRQYIRGGITDNARTAALYRRAKIGLNIHRQSKGFGRDAPRVTDAESLNPRAYELAASGCFQISDSRAEQVEVFGPHVLAFRTPDELGACVRWALRHDERRAEQVEGTLRWVQPHTFEARARQIMADLERVGRERVAVPA